MPADPPRIRCTETTAAGRPCRMWATADSCRAGRPRCQWHERHGSDFLPATDDRRCTATTADGTRCRQWAEGESDRCATHSRDLRPAAGDPRRCRAMTRAGTRCRRFATAASRRAGRPRCFHHSEGGRRPDPAPAQRCTATTAAGARCRRWALRETWGDERPLCIMHRDDSAQTPTASAPRAGRRCTATTLAGRRCRKWTLPNRDRCQIHAFPHTHPRLRHGLRRARRTPQEQVAADLVAEAAPADSLAGEIAVLRLRLRGGLAYLSRSDLTAAERRGAARAMIRLVRAVDRLVRAENE